MPEVKTKKEEVKGLTYKCDGKEVALNSVIDEKKDLWDMGRNKIIKLEGLQKIAEKEGIVEKDFKVEIVPTKDNHQQHVVTVWIGKKGDTDKDNWKRGSGEASVLNTGGVKNVTVKDDQGNPVTQLKVNELAKIDSKYKFAMAEKRAFSRALLKYIQLYGVYCDIESPDFAKKSDSDIDY